MSEAKYQLRKLRNFILKRGRELRTIPPPEVDAEEEEVIEDHVFAVSMRVDEDRIIIREIDRMLKFKQSGRKKKAA